MTAGCAARPCCGGCDFYLVCGLGVFANVGLASLLFLQQPTWWLAALAGALVGTVWNYAISVTLVSAPDTAPRWRAARQQPVQRG